MNAQKFYEKDLDSKAIPLFLEQVSETKENSTLSGEYTICGFDRMPYVKGVAWEAQRVAEMHCNLATGSNFELCGTPKKSSWCSGRTSPTSLSPESLTFDFSMEYDSLESPLTSIHGSLTSFHDRWSASRKPCRYQGRVVDVSPKDGLFSASSNGHGICSTGESDGIDNFQDFTGFQQRSPTNYPGRTPSPQRPRSQVDLDDACIFNTPRKLIRSLQEPSDFDWDISKKHHAQYGSPCSTTNKWSPSRKYDKNGSTVEPNGDEEDGSSYARNKKQLSYDSVSKGHDAWEDSVLPVPVALDGVGPPVGLCTKTSWKTNFIKACSVLFVFAAVLVSMLLMDEGGAHDHLVPT